MSKSISLLLLVSMIAGIRAACMCRDWIGVHCGDRKSGQNQTLREESPGDCNTAIMYQCPAANIPAQNKGYCSYCARGNLPGTDYCAIGREGSKATCTCGEYIGVHCASRAQNGYLNGDCDAETIWQCPAKGVPAQNKGKCSYCAEGAVPGTDYCAIGRNHRKSKLFQ